MTTWLFSMLVGLAFFSICWYNETKEEQKRVFARLFLWYAGLVTAGLYIYYVLTNPVLRYD